ncbi:MAG TPA: histidinol-phosphate transaminase [Propionicimonas sp.]|uniref:histidinol-phosphate transaminase n=1 Tax=Propionicimonas sp. TaxID=1955623 RepID=UPI002F3F27B4
MSTLPQQRPAVAGLPAYVAGRKASGEQVAALASNESHYPPLPKVLDAIAAASARVNRYPDMATATLRDRIAQFAGVSPSSVAVGPGSVGVLAQLIAAVCDPGDEVVFAWRSFEAYPILCQIAGAEAVRVPLVDERHDLRAMAAAVTDRTRVVLLCSPNNPTGTSISTAELIDFLDRVPGRVLVVLDEAYREFVGAESPDAVGLLETRYPNLCVLRTFSKAYGLAGLRVGYAIAHPDIADGLRKTQIPFSVSNVAEAAALAALDSADEVAERVAAVVAERPRVEAGARASGWAVPAGAANFVWLRADDHTRERLVAAFDAAGVMVRGYAGDGVRVTLADPASNDRVLAVLAAFRHEV